jgi:hypothetical protein
LPTVGLKRFFPVTVAIAAVVGWSYLVFSFVMHGGHHG